MTLCKKLAAKTIHTTVKIYGHLVIRSSRHSVLFIWSKQQRARMPL